MTEGQTPLSNDGEIIAAASRDYRWKRYLLVAVLLGYGIWSIHDGFFKWPQENDARRAKGFPDAHSSLDIKLNQSLGMLLPPLSVVFLVWSLYQSRGVYRFDGTTLHVPGHPPIPLNAVRKLNREKWDRKGIAFVDYQIPGTARAGRIRLDDFIYEREPVDQIFAVIETSLGGETAAVIPSVPAAAARSTTVPPPAAIKPRPRPGTDPAR